MFYHTISCQRHASIDYYLSKPSGAAADATTHSTRAAHRIHISEREQMLHIWSSLDLSRQDGSLCRRRYQYHLSGRARYLRGQRLGRHELILGPRQQPRADVVPTVMNASTSPSAILQECFSLCAFSLPVAGSRCSAGATHGRLLRCESEVQVRFSVMTSSGCCFHLIPDAVQSLLLAMLRASCSRLLFLLVIITSLIAVSAFSSRIYQGRSPGYLGRSQIPSMAAQPLML